MILKKFIAERNAVLLSLDKQKILDYGEKYGLKFPNSDLIFWAAVHKARLSILNFPEEEKETSRAWLIENGFDREVI